MTSDQLELHECDHVAIEHACVLQWRLAASQRAASIQQLMFDSKQGRWLDLCIPDALLCQPARSADAQPLYPNSAAKTTVAAREYALVDMDRMEQLGRSSAVTAVAWLPFLWGMPGCVSRSEPQASDCKRQEAQWSADALTQAMMQSGLVGANGLLNTTTQRSGQQWDAPNCWPPLLCMWVDGLLANGSRTGQNFARRLAQAYLRAVDLGLQQSGVVWEKYGTDADGQCGGGGEYEPQVGFGWSNGVALHVMLTLGVTLP